MLAALPSRLRRGEGAKPSVANTELCIARHQTPDLYIFSHPECFHIGAVSPVLFIFQPFLSAVGVDIFFVSRFGCFIRRERPRTSQGACMHRRAPSLSSSSRESLLMSCRAVPSRALYLPDMPHPPGTVTHDTKRASIGTAALWFWCAFVLSRGSRHHS